MNTFSKAMLEMPAGTIGSSIPGKLN